MKSKVDMKLPLPNVFPTAYRNKIEFQRDDVIHPPLLTEA